MEKKSISIVKNPNYTLPEPPEEEEYRPEDFAELNDANWEQLRDSHNGYIYLGDTWVEEEPIDDDEDWWDDEDEEE